jgi:hypothetical protein
MIVKLQLKARILLWFSIYIYCPLLRVIHSLHHSCSKLLPSLTFGMIQFLRFFVFRSFNARTKENIFFTISSLSLSWWKMVLRQNSPKNLENICKVNSNYEFNAFFLVHMTSTKMGRSNKAKNILLLFHTPYNQKHKYSSSRYPFIKLL